MADTVDPNQPLYKSGTNPDATTTKPRVIRPYVKPETRVQTAELKPCPNCAKITALHFAASRVSQKYEANL